MAGEAKGSEMAQSEKERREAIRLLNDKLRKEGVGGCIMITEGIQALASETRAKILPAIRLYDDFNDGNDPYGEHDCAAIEVDRNRIFWKIDYYDLTMQFGSADPTDPAVTERVMTIMLAEEY